MKPWKEVIDGIRNAVLGKEVREDLAQMGEYVEQFANTAGENIQKAIDPTLSLSGKAADAAKVGKAVGQIKEDLDIFENDVANKIVVGKNKFNKDYVTHGYWYRIDNKKLEANNNMGYTNRFYDRNNSYVVNDSCFLAVFNENGTFYSGTELRKGDSFELSDYDNAGVFVAYCFVLSVYLSSLDYFQLEIGKNCSSYESYRINIPYLMLNHDRIITVGKSSTYNFTKIKDAINNANDGDVVIIYPGVYEENLSLSNGVDLRNGKNISLIGIDREKCIIKSYKVDRQTPPLEFSNGHIANLTIIADRKEDIDVSEISSLPYAIHIDYNGSTNNIIVIENCNLESKWNSAIGVGMRGGMKLMIKNCDLYTHVVDSYPVNMGALYFHDTPNDGTVGTSNITIENCYIHTNYKYVLTLDNVGRDGDKVNAHFVKNRFWSDMYKKTLEGIFAMHVDETGTGLFKCKNIYLHEDSFGNNIAALNSD